MVDNILLAGRMLLLILFGKKENCPFEPKTHSPESFLPIGTLSRHPNMQWKGRALML